MSTPLDLIFLSGSLRTGSYNSHLLRAIREVAPPELRLTPQRIDDLPIFNPDLEQGESVAAVVALQHAVRAADGLVIATPEYNHSVPGGLKNAIDWLSRGKAPHALFGMPTAILGASDGPMGTTRAQYHLRQILTALNAPTMNFPQVLVMNARSRFNDQGDLTDEPTRKLLGKWAVEVARWMRRFPRSDR